MIYNDGFYLLEKIPAVLRARGFRLYLSNGKRLVDLWLNGGAAVLGHTPPNLLRELKNTASRGLYAPYPHFTKDRFLKALSKLFPDRSFRLYAAPPPELTALNNSAEVKLWRPFSEAQDTQILILVLPGIQSWRNGLPMGLCITAVYDEKLLSQLPPDDVLSPVLLAAAVRGVHDIIAAPERTKIKFPRVMKILKQSNWQRQGIYLTLKKETTLEEWETLFHKFLEAGFLLPPSPAYPLILPGELSDGEEAKLASALN
ncbi:MAG: hypothetical protein FWD40_11830 [Treponema sp.]|nr:hypothetical protein [Treponema sp.]